MLFKLIQQLGTDPKSFVAPSQNAARNEVNDNFSGVGDALRKQFLTGAGGGGTGKYGKAALQSDLQRRSSLSQVDSNFNQQAAALPLTAAQLMQQFLGMDFGSTTTGKSTGTTGATGTTSTAGTDVGTTDTTGSSSTDRNVTEKGSSTSFGAKVGI